MTLEEEGHLLQTSGRIDGELCAVALQKEQNVRSADISGTLSIAILRCAWASLDWCSIETGGAHCRRKAGDDEDSGSSDEDEFYDRTAPGKAKKHKTAPVVHDAASLFGRKVRSCSLAQVKGCSCMHILMAYWRDDAPPTPAWRSVLSIRNDGPNAQSAFRIIPGGCLSKGGPRSNRASPPAPGDPSALSTAPQEALLEERKWMQQTLDEELAGEAGKAVHEATQTAADPLDAFMSDVAVQLEQSKVRQPGVGMVPVPRWRH